MILKRTKLTKQRNTIKVIFEKIQYKNWRKMITSNPIQVLKQEDIFTHNNFKDNSA